MDSTLESSTNRIIHFLRKKDYRLVKELGEGGCGKTVLLHDESVDEYYVCKKYAPEVKSLKEDLFKYFKQEIKLMHSLYHPNVVRIFNSYLYPSTYSGYILMEYIEGLEVIEYVGLHKASADEVFRQTIGGFAYMEEVGVLHRDIRPRNLMVANDGTVKIIDLGFSKKINQTVDFNKSISLNWWCELPDEFQTSTYNFSTEVYFVGKLFEKIIKDCGASEFTYMDILQGMCHINPDDRIASFKKVLQKTRSEKFKSLSFSESEKYVYRQFADSLCQQITKIERSTVYVKEIETIRKNLEEVYRGNSLETHVSDAFAISRCFLKGAFFGRPLTMSMEVLKDFLAFFNGEPEDKRAVVLANIHSRLNAIARYDAKEDEIPF